VSVKFKAGERSFPSDSTLPFSLTWHQNFRIVGFLSLFYWTNFYNNISPSPTMENSYRRKFYTSIPEAHHAMLYKLLWHFFSLV